MVTKLSVTDTSGSVWQLAPTQDKLGPTHKNFVSSCVSEQMHIVQYILYPVTILFRCLVYFTLFYNQTFCVLIGTCHAKMRASNLQEVSGKFPTGKFV